MAFSLAGKSALITGGSSGIGRAIARRFREVGAEVLVVPPSVGGVKEITDYFKLFDYDINLIVEAIEKSSAGK